MKINEENLKKAYGFDKADYTKYMPAGGVLLEYIGQEIIMVKFTRAEDGKWYDKVSKVYLTGMDDFEPLNLTYNLKYKTASGEEHEIRVIQEGYSFGNPEETGEMYKFLPYSYHCRLVEDEMFNKRLEELYNTCDTLTIENLKDIVGSKDKDEILRYSHNIQAVIKLNSDSSILNFRVTDIKLVHKVGTKYNLVVSDKDENYSIPIDSKETEYSFFNLGKIKLINIKGEA